MQNIHIQLELSKVAFRIVCMQYIVDFCHHFCGGNSRPVVCGVIYNPKSRFGCLFWGVVNFMTQNQGISRYWIDKKFMRRGNLRDNGNIFKVCESVRQFAAISVVLLSCYFCWCKDWFVVKIRRNV